MVVCAAGVHFHCSSAHLGVLKACRRLSFRPPSSLNDAPFPLVRASLSAAADDRSSKSHSSYKNTSSLCRTWKERQVCLNSASNTRMAAHCHHTLDQPCHCDTITQTSGLVANYTQHTVGSSAATFPCAVFFWSHGAYFQSLPLNVCARVPVLCWRVCTLRA